MKKILRFGLLAVSLLLSFCQQTFAQNYQPFRQNLTYHFIAQDSIYSMRIDSVKIIGGDSVFVFNKIARKRGIASGPTCNGSPAGPAFYAVHANNQFGAQMQKKPSGEYRFKTAQGQEYLLKTKANTGQSWTFNATANLTATLTSKGIEQVATLTDSVVTYTLSNGKVLKLSKNYGFVSAPNFISYTDSYFRPKDLTFYALPEKGIGQQISSPFAIYNFQPGDKFSYYQKHEIGSIMFTGICSEEWIQREVLSRRNSPNGDTIYYSIQEQKLTKGYGTAGSPWCSIPTATTLHAPTTFNLVVTRNYEPFTNALSNGFFGPAQPAFGNGRVLTGIFKNSLFNQREQISCMHLNYDNCAKTFSPTLDMGKNTTVARGIGLVYYQDYSSLGLTTIELKAYIKGAETYGTWRTLAQILATNKELESKPLVKAFPNPFSSVIILATGETSGNMLLTLQNPLGQTVWQKQIEATANAEIKLELPELAKGMYVLQASQQGKIFTSRLVKE